MLQPKTKIKLLFTKKSRHCSQICNLYAGVNSQVSFQEDKTGTMRIKKCQWTVKENMIAYISRVCLDRVKYLVTSACFGTLFFMFLNVFHSLFLLFDSTYFNKLLCTPAILPRGNWVSYIAFAWTVDLEVFSLKTLQVSFL